MDEWEEIVNNDILHLIYIPNRVLSGLFYPSFPPLSKPGSYSHCFPCCLAYTFQMGALASLWANGSALDSFPSCFPPLELPHCYTPSVHLLSCTLYLSFPNFLIYLNPTPLISTILLLTDNAM